MHRKSWILKIHNDFHTNFYLDEGKKELFIIQIFIINDSLLITYSQHFSYKEMFVLDNNFIPAAMMTTLITD